MNRSREAARLEREIREAREKLEMLERLPDRDAYPDGAIIRVVVRPRYGAHEPLTYVLLRVVPPAGHDPTVRWYFTGRLLGAGSELNQRRWVSWDGLIAWLINEVELVSWNCLRRADGTITAELEDDVQHGTYNLTQGTDGIYRI